MFRIFGRLSFHFKKYKKEYSIAIICIILADFLVMFPPVIISRVSDEIYARTISSENLTYNILILMFTTALAYVISYVWQYYMFHGGDMLAHDMRLKLFKKILKQSARFFETHTSGDLMTNVSGDVDSLQETAGFGVMALLDATVFPAIVLVMMIISSSLKLTVLSVLPLILLVPITVFLGRKINRAWTVIQNTNSEVNDAVLENVSGVRVVRAFGAEGIQEEDFYRLSNRSYKENVIVGYWQYAYSFFATLIPIASYTLCVYFGAIMVRDGQLTLGNVIGMQIYLSYMIWPMISMGEFINSTEMGNAGLDRINSTLAYQEDVVDSKDAIRLKSIGNIVFDGLTFKYPTSINENLKNIRLTIPRGNTLGIVGKTGSGKSTLIKQFLREYAIEECKLVLDGTPIERYDMESLADAISYVPQENILFSKSIRENILLGAPDALDEELDEVVRITDLERDLNSFNEGIETMAGEKGISLSGGQKQRIAIARALIRNSELLILDDCLSAVDANTEKNIIEHIRERRKGRTSIIVSHRLSAVTHADEIIVMDDGAIVERGTHEELISSGGWYAEQYEYQKNGGVGHAVRK